MVGSINPYLTPLRILKYVRLTDCISDLSLSLELSSHSGQIYTDVNIAKFASPTFRITRPSCITFAFIAQAEFYVKLAYLVEGRYKEKLLHRNIQSMMSVQQFYTLSRDIDVIPADGHQFVLILEARCSVPGEQLTVDEVLVTPHPCTGETQCFEYYCIHSSLANKPAT